jgi:hypothetical protein
MNFVVIGEIAENQTDIIYGKNFAELRKFH